MEYCDMIALGPERSISTTLWKKYVDDTISVAKKASTHCLHHLNSVDLHIKFTREAPGNDCRIPFLDTECSPCSLKWYKPLSIDNQQSTSNQPISVKKAVIHALIYRAEIGYFPNLEILTKEMDCLQRVPLKKYLPRLNDQTPRKETTNSYYKPRCWPRSAERCLPFCLLYSWPQWEI